MDGGVLGVLPGIIGSLQAMEALKLLAGIGEPLVGRLLHYDATAARFREFKLRPDAACALCGEAPTITSPTALPGHPPPGGCGGSASADVHGLRELLGTPGVTLLDVRQPEERAVCRIEPSIAIPLGELGERFREIPRDGKLFVHCKSGGRSARAVKQLEEAGFANAINVEGGIDAWRAEIEPNLPGG